MTDPAQAAATQRRNIETRISRTFEDLRDELLASGLVKHGEVRSLAMETFGLGYGDANALAHYALEMKRPSAAVADGDALAQIYPLKKAHLRAIHDAVVAAITPWGDYEIAPKKAYVAFRRTKQFAMLGPKTSERTELGINFKDDVSSGRLVKQKPGGMCQYVVSLARPEDLDQEVLAVLRRAFDAAG